VKGGPVFLDSGIFIAFLDRSDQYHAAAVRLFAVPPRRWYCSMPVISESYGWFLHRLGEEAARTFRLFVEALPRLDLLPVDRVHHAAVARKLDRFRGHKLTYVDASTLVFLEIKKIPEVWGTDRDLGLEGARIAPISIGGARE
jgi:predicted nucleic acid-binding protein